MNRKNLHYTLSDISDTFISEANEIREGNASAVAAAQKRRKITFVSGVMAAACACVCGLTLAIVLPLQNNTKVGDIPNNSSHGISTPGDGNIGDLSGGQEPPSSAGQAPMQIYGVGSVRSGIYGSVRFASMTEYSATFEFDITSDVPYDSDILISFYNFVEEGKTPKICRLTTRDYDYGGERLPIDLLKLTVNGELSSQYKMPDKVGHYEVVFDYSDVFEDYDKMAVATIEFTSLQYYWTNYRFDIIADLR